jgi:tellurite resistance protein TehA-like permease
MGPVTVLVLALLVLAVVMYWIFSATARHTELRAKVLAQPARRGVRSPGATPDL